MTTDKENNSSTDADATRSDVKNLGSESGIRMENYVPYRAKTYLTFTILSNQQSEDAELLNKVYTEHAKKIEETLVANRESGSIASDIAEIADKMTKAVVVSAAEKRLRNSPTANHDAIIKKLETLYGEPYKKAFEEVKGNLDAQRELDTLTAPTQTSSVQIISELLGGIPDGDLRHILDNKKIRSEFLKNLGEVDPDRAAKLSEALALYDALKKLKPNPQED